MTKRERVLALLLLPPLLLFGGGFLAYQLWYGPLKAKDRLIAEVSNEIDEKELALSIAAKKRKDIQTLKPMSLPADTGLARRSYEEELSKMLHAAGYEAGSFSVTSKQVDTKTSPVFKDKKPVYSRLVFTVNAKGELLSAVDFLERFYRTRLLHQIRNFTLQRQATADRNRGNELEMNLTIEALSMDGAENRKTLLPEAAPDVPPLLAGGERKYKSIAGKDMFYGPPPPTPVSQPKPPPKYDFAEFVKFDSYTSSSDGVPVATLYDAFNDQEICIRPTDDGYKVEVSYLLNKKKRTLRSGRTLDIMDDNKDLQHRWLVLKYDERQLYMQDDEAYFVLRLGQRLSEMTRLTMEEAASYGLVQEKAAAPEDKGDKGEKPVEKN